MPGPFPSELQVVGIGKEAAWGTPVAADYYLSAKSPSFEDIINYIKDDGARGAMATTYAVYPGPGNGMAKTEFPVFVDSIGRLLGGIIGPDTVAGTAAPYSHTFQLAGGQPASLTVLHNDGLEVRQYAGARLTELAFKWSEGAELTGTMQADTMLSVVAGVTTPAFPTAFPAMEGWMASCTLGGANDAQLVGLDLTLKRKAYIQHAANGNQGPSSIIAKGLEVTGKATFDYAATTELNDFLNNTQPAFVVTLTNGTYSVKLQMSKCAFLKAPFSGKDVVQLDVDFEGLNNATDGGPIEAVVVNGVSAAY